MYLSIAFITILLSFVINSKNVLDESRLNKMIESFRLS